MEFHDAANIFPMEDETLDELSKDIKANGLQFPIERFGGKIIDGRRRFMACKMAGVSPEFVDVEPSDPVAYVLSLNLHRRHLTTSQRAMVAARARDMYDKQAKERQRARKGEQPGATVENLPHLDDASRARDAAGKAVGVSGKTVDHATQVLTMGTPELIGAVDAGDIAVSTAAQIASLDKEHQPAAVAGKNPVRGKILREVETRGGATRKELEAGLKINGNTLRPRVAELIDAGLLKETRQRRDNSAVLQVSSGKAKPEPPTGERKSRGIGIRQANAAIDCLKKIPQSDGLRAEAFAMVRDWIKHNR